MAWNLNDYETVESRLEKFIADYPDFRIDTELLAHTDKRFIVRAAIYRTYLDTVPFATGLAYGDISDRGVNQTSALEKIKEGFADKSTVLLHGVTSSGKTEVYTHLIREQLESGKQVLFLLPEIELTTQLIGRLQEHFGAAVLIYHSRFNEQERVEVYNEVLKKKPCVVIGARSSLFLPYNNLAYLS